ncbi:MAG: B12-binding domain-containing radical SAM protein [Dehalococcoidia bacterium]
MNRPVMLVNANVVEPPVSPVGLEYVGEALSAEGIPVRPVDLALEPDWRKALGRELENSQPLAVGVTVRNTDDSSLATKHSFLPWIRDVVNEIKAIGGPYVILGGGGFSIMPESVLRFTGADIGVAGDGEHTMPMIAKQLDNGDDIADLPNVVHRKKKKVVCNRRVDVDPQHLPLPRRRIFDNPRYEQLGAMVGIETKRGCSEACIFCADPVAKGHNIRLRPPSTVAREFHDLVAQGVTWFHLCDSEFNLPISHAKEVCHALIEAGLGERIHWYCYCAPVPFDRELVTLMRKSGCNGIGFGVDSLHDEQLARLGRTHRIANVQRLVATLKDEGMNFMIDLLAGGPGETEETLRYSIDKVRELDVPLAGIALGLRVYAGTPLAKALSKGSIKEGLHPGSEDTPELSYYLSPNLGDDAFSLLGQLVGGDSRFLSLSLPSEEGSYNYAGDEMLSTLIKKGARGAYWDILSRQGE